MVDLPLTKNCIADHRDGIKAKDDETSYRPNGTWLNDWHIGALNGLNWTRADRKERDKETFYALFDINNEKSGEKNCETFAAAAAFRWFVRRRGTAI